MRIEYRGTTGRAGRRQYKVIENDPCLWYTVTAENETEWDYSCNCGAEDCAHVDAVKEDRNAFDAADARMGDPNP
jgi:hypothetical protein